MENKLVPIEHNGVRVITTELLAQVYETDTNNIKNNFNNHKDNFREGVHYYLLKGDELRAFKREVNNIDLVAPNVNQLYLWTERGANRHCKILDTPKAWEQFDNLEETYFMVKEQRKAAIGGKVEDCGIEVYDRITQRSWPPPTNGPRRCCSMPRTGRRVSFKSSMTGQAPSRSIRRWLSAISIPRMGFTSPAWPSKI